MATYVMSDIHGEYEKYRGMLKKIHFSDSDRLFVLGDVLDRGPEPMAVLLDMLGRWNVFPILGNHDLLGLDLLKKLSVEITEENYASQIDVPVMNQLLDWISNGGQTTIETFRRLDEETRAMILDYLTEFSLYEVVDVGEKTFILVHAGLGHFRKDKKLKEYTAQELLMERGDPNLRCFDDDSIYVVWGHTPTQLISGSAEIYHNCNHICIDCGACQEGGRLACLCLDTMEEFYI